MPNGISDPPSPAPVYACNDAKTLDNDKSRAISELVLQSRSLVLMAVRTAYVLLFTLIK